MKQTRAHRCLTWCLDSTTRRIVVLAAVVLVALAFPLAAHAQPSTAIPLAPDDLRPTLDPDPEAQQQSPSASTVAAATNKMMSWVESNLGPALGMKNPRQEWTIARVSLNKQDLWAFKLNQVFKGIPVVGGHLSISLQDAAGFGTPEWHGQYLKDPEVDTNPKISAGKAKQVVHQLRKNEVGHPGGGPKKNGDEKPSHKLAAVADDPDPKAGLEIHPGEGPGKRKLTYHVVMSDTSTVNPVQLHAWVGAQADNAGQLQEAWRAGDGTPQMFYNNIQTSQACNGFTAYQGVASYFLCTFWPAAGVFVLNDNSLRIGAYDAYSNCNATYQASSLTPTFGTFSLGNRNTSNADTLYASVQSMSYFYYKLGRNYVDGNYGPKVFASVDGLGPLLSARNHVCANYNNAYWDGQKINIGDGDGSFFRSLATLDIVGHEWGHGVTQFEANLQYVNESGALNESFSDIFGAMAERYWKGDRFIACPAGVFTACSLTGQIGEAAFTPFTGGDALRFMYAPTRDGSSRDHYSQRYTGTADNGGVHWNSGIQNNAFWLLAYGGCHRFAGCMGFAPIGADAAALIFYVALRDYMLPTDGFFWARRTTQYAAGVLYGFGSLQHLATIRAWDLVGAP